MTARKSQPRAVFVGVSFFRRLADLVDRREPVVVVTVAEASGSAPGRPGAKLVVSRDGAYGTVGGGRVENAALEHARTLIGASTGPEIVRYDVVQDLGMTCGGSMSLTFEPITPSPRLVIFGAGHVAQPLCAVAVLAGFEATVIDERPDWLTEERFPDARERILCSWDEAVDRARIDGHTFVVSVSPGHTVDEALMKKVLAADVRPRYLGVIGSRRKGAVIRKNLGEAGIAAEGIEALHIPMGLNIGAAEPREIAVSIVAEMIAELRGMKTVEPW